MGTFVPLLVLVFIASQNTASSQRTCFAGSFRDGKTCSPCPPGTFSNDFNQLSCTPCRERTFRATEGAKSEEQCLPCPAGTATNSKGSSKCKPCPPGTDSLPGSEVCLSCPKGSVLSRYSSGCEECESPFFADKEQSKSCKLCPDGTFAAGGRTRRRGATKCEKCPVGTFRRNDPFIFNPASNSECGKCAAGRFNDKEGAASCKLCPPGTFSKPGASKCTPCPKNTFNNRIPATRCRLCPAGTGTQGMGAAACKHSTKGCTFDTFEGKDGNCKACMPGEKLDKRKKACIPCGKNEVSDGGVNTECKKCPKNQIPLGRETVLERSACDCAPGLLNDGENGCVPCPPGSFWKIESSDYNFVGVGPSPFFIATCSPCPPGTFSDKSGTLSCMKCPENTFQILTFSDRAIYRSTCTQCPPGSRSPRLVDDQTDTDRGKCVVDETACEPGQVRNRDGNCERVSCPFENTALVAGRCVRCEPRVTEGGKLKCVVPNELNKNCTNGKRSDLDGNCSCPLPKIELNDGCVKRCPAGLAPQHLPSTLSVGFSGKDKCLPCPSRERSDRDFCISCPSNTIAMRGRNCTRCPAGQVVQRDIFGRLLDKCRHSDPYF